MTPAAQDSPRDRNALKHRAFAPKFVAERISDSVQQNRLLALTLQAVADHQRGPQRPFVHFALSES